MDDGIASARVNLYAARIVGPARNAVAAAAAAAALAIVVAAPDATAALFMSAPLSVATPAAPARVRINDLNNDGYPDLVVSNNGANSVSVHMGTAGGGFSAAVSYAVGAGPTDLDLVDMNHDGRADIVVVNNTGNSVSVLQGNGDGTFRAATTYPVGANPTRLLTIVGGDNFGRIVTVNTSGNSITYMAALAAGGISSPVNFPVGNGPTDVITADLDGDGIGEFVVANGADGTISVITRITGGAPGSAVTYTVGTTPTRLARGDAEGTGKVGIVVTNAGSNSLSYLSNAGNRALNPAITIPLPASPRGIVHPMVDLNGDGRADVVVRNDDSSVTVILVPSTTGAAPTITTYPLGSKGSGFGVNAFDFDGDGRVDIMATNADDGKWMMLPGLGGGAFGPLLSFAAGANAGTRWSTTDVTGDGKWDVVAVPNATANTVSVLKTSATPPTLGTVIEFYNTGLDNYFITADPNEAAAIDSGSAGPGWQRTGPTFNFKSGGNTYACRFYGSITPGPNSHFYTALPSECEGLKQIQASTPATVKRWNFESLDFVTTLPAGTCPSGTTPVYRAYNNGAARGVDSNHRITINRAGIDQVIARGWVDEGIQMCAPL